MKKKLLYIFIIFCFLFIPQLVNAQEEVNLYLFHSKDCIHCQSEREWLASIKEEYQYLNIYEYEVTRNEENSALLQKVKKQLSSTTKYVPFTVIGETYFVGWNENNKNKILEKIENYNYEQRDIVNEVLNGIEGEPIVKQDNEEQDGVSTFTIPLLGNIDAKKVSLPLVAAIIGFIDGFNPCAMWVLIFLISMLMGMKNKKRMWTLGLTFLCSSAMVYLLFMLAWLNIAISLNQIVWVRVLVAIVALIGAF